MSLTAGSRLGHYDITAKLGEGGMGEVWRARDTKLDRDVALKVLPRAFTEDPDRLARFEREAKILASLNHPGIAAIYGIEEADGIRALVLELVEGPTLADRIATGPIPLEDALPIAKQIAEALEAAHEAGVIHRDLKPANVKVKDDGTVKVLDFGLAKALEPEVSEADAANSPTMTAAATKMGVIMGTAAYMSPEQARGKPVDRRADIWAFGCVLYEVLTGRQAFKGETVADTLAAIVGGRPDGLPPATPEAVRRLLARCLAKGVRQRLQHIGDVRPDIQEAIDSLEPQRGVASARSVRLRTWLPWAIAGVCGPLALISYLRPPAEAPRDVTRLSFTTPPLAGETDAALAISPGGRRIAYVADDGGGPRLYLRQLDGDSAEALEGTEGAAQPFFSSDEEWVGFFASGELKKAPTRGGPVRVVAAAPNGPRGASWLPDDDIVFRTFTPASLYRVSSEGGEPEIEHAGDLEGGDGVHFYPSLLPDGHSVLTLDATNFVQRGLRRTDDATISVVDFITGETTSVLEGGQYPKFATSGHLVYARGGQLFAVPFDPNTLMASGPPLAVLDNLRMSDTDGSASFDVSSSGTLVYASGGVPQTRQLVWVTRAGEMRPVEAERHRFEDVSLSADGRRAAVSFGTAAHDLWMVDLERGSMNRLTSQWDNHGAVWSPDGEYLIFSSNRAGARNLFSVDVTDPDDIQRVAPSDHDQYVASFAPDGSALAFDEIAPGSSSDIWVVSMASGERRVVVGSDFNERRPAISPTGDWIAYEADEGGRWDIYLQSFPRPGERIAVSTEGGTEPVWAPSGRELFYRHGDRLMAVTLDEGSPARPSGPRTLFEADLFSGRFSGYSIAPDGQRFLFVTNDSRPEATEIHVVLNWAEELKAQAPTGQ